jgi:acetyltransferase-like isoleucine patch superfamily enzyme
MATPPAITIPIPRQRLTSGITWPLLRRWLTPQPVVRLLYLWRYGAFVSGRAEVEYASDARIGRGCVFSSFSKVKIAGPLEMGERVQVASGCFLSVGVGGVTIGDDVLIGPNCTIVSNSYRYDRLGVPCAQQGTTSAGVRIGRHAWIGANSVVLDGASIGDGVVVSAGSVVSGTVPPNTVVLGNPARVIFKRR